MAEDGTLGKRHECKVLGTHCARLDSTVMLDSELNRNCITFKLTALSRSIWGVVFDFDVSFALHRHLIIHINDNTVLPHDRNNHVRSRMTRHRSIACHDFELVYDISWRFLGFFVIVIKFHVADPSYKGCSSQ